MVTPWRLRPGDIVEWRLTKDGGRISNDELLWSGVEQRWVPIGHRHLHLLVASHDGCITWLNNRGVFRALERGWTDGARTSEAVTVRVKG